MGADSKIEWTAHTFNPWEGCVKVSPACDNCYAAERDARWHAGQHWGKDAFRMLHTESYWRQPILWNLAAKAARTRARVFCGSLCDVMEDRPDVDAIRQAALYPLIEECGWLDWLLLTKRPQNFRRFLPRGWLHNPRPNIWGMTTVESMEFVWRIRALIDTPLAMRGLSMEPLLSPVDLRPYLRDIDWVIAGGESGRQARPSHPHWFRDLRGQCTDAGVPFFFKQWGEWNGTMGVGKVGKHKAGRLLDGREWNEVPTARDGATQDRPEAPG